MKNLVISIKESLDKLAKSVVIAIDGRSGSGKSKLAKEFATKFDGTIICCDNFYVGGSNDTWLAKSPAERVVECIDWQRIRTDVLEPLLQGKEASYYPFDFQSGHGLAQQAVVVKPTKVIILDGAYSARPELADLVDIKILMEALDDIRRKRLLESKGAEFMQNWHRIWDAAEDYYFQKVCPPEWFDIVM